MKLSQSLVWSLIIAFQLAASLQSGADSKSNKEAEATEATETIPTAVLYGMSGERYVLYGTGGVTVEQSPKPGMWHSNMFTYKIRIDGGNSGGDTHAGNIAGSSAFAPASLAARRLASNFFANSGGAYFVSGTAVCTLPSATGCAGKEILVCNTSKDGTITYNTSSGESISGSASGALTNSTANKVDRFISDGSNWYRE